MIRRGVYLLNASRSDLYKGGDVEGPSGIEGLAMALAGDGLRASVGEQLATLAQAIREAGRGEP